MAAIRKCGLCRAPGHNRSACPASAFREDGRYGDEVPFSAALEALPQRPEGGWRAAWTAARAAYKTGDHDGPYTKVIHAALEELTTLKDRLTAAATVADFMLCAITAGKTPHGDFGAIDWADDNPDHYMRAVSDYATKAVTWLLWMEKHPAGKGPRHGVYGTDNLEDARQKALATLDACIGKLL
jgi:hypothetical protein